MERVKGLDICRIAGCILVIVNHANSKVLQQVAPMSAAWFVTSLTVYITKIAVPLFFMITGYNLLHREDSFSVYIRRIVRIAGVLAVFTLFYYIWKCISGAYGADQIGSGADGLITGYFRVLFRDTVTDSYWYLYTYLGLLIMMPVFQKVAAAFAPETILKAVVAALVPVSLIPMIAVLVPGFTLSDHFDLPGICIGVLYLFVGHVYYSSRDKAIPSKFILLCGFVSGFVTDLIFMMAEYGSSGGTSHLTASEIHYTGVFLMSTGFFGLMLRTEWGTFTDSAVKLIAPATFGIYLIGDFLCSMTHLVYFYLCPHMNRLFAVAIQDILVLTAGFMIVYLARLIPPVRKWI